MSQVVAAVHSVGNFACRSVGTAAGAAGELLTNGIRKINELYEGAPPVTAGMQDVLNVTARRDELKSALESAKFNRQAPQFSLFCCASTLAIGLTLVGTSAFYIPLGILLVGGSLYFSESLFQAWRRSRIKEKDLEKQVDQAEKEVAKAWSDYFEKENLIREKNLAKRSLSERQSADSDRLKMQVAPETNTGANLPPLPRDV
jgi:hypothetical protein